MTPAMLRPWLLCAALLLSACAARLPAPDATAQSDDWTDLSELPDLNEPAARAPADDNQHQHSTPEEAAWKAVLLPGKRATIYRWELQDGQRVLSARADGSASMMRKRLDIAPEALGVLSFSWRIDASVTGGNVAEASREDAAARVLLAFGGDVARLPQRTRLMFELAQALTGEAPPYATLMYVWDATAPVGSVIVNPRTDRVRKIVLDSGPPGANPWRSHRRDVAADFRLAFGEEPGRLQALAVMTDTDNTRTQAATWYGPVVLH